MLHDKTTWNECNYNCSQLQSYCFTWYTAQKQRGNAYYAVQTLCRLAWTYKDALILKWAMKYTGLKIIAGHREELISSPNEWWAECCREDSLQLCPLMTQRHAERLPGVNTHTSCLCIGQGSCWASRMHQIIGRALPCEAMRQGDGVQRKTHNLSRWFVWWTNSMQTERWRKSTKYRKSFASDKGRANVCASVCLTHPDWHPIGKKRKDL